MKIKRNGGVWFLTEGDRMRWFLSLDEMFNYIKECLKTKSLEGIFTNGQYKLSEVKDKELIDIIAVMEDVGYYNEMAY